MVATLAALLLLAPAADAPKLSEAAAKELKRFEGKWQILKEVRSDGERDRSADPDAVLVFKGHKISEDGKDVGEIATLDPTTDPKCLDLKIAHGPFQGTTAEAVYKIDGDSLTIAVCVMGKNRPANFDKPSAAGTFLVTLKRVKD